MRSSHCALTTVGALPSARLTRQPLAAAPLSSPSSMSAPSSAQDGRPGPYLHDKRLRQNSLVSSGLVAAGTASLLCTVVDLATTTPCASLHHCVHAPASSLRWYSLSGGQRSGRSAQGSPRPSAAIGGAGTGAVAALFGASTGPGSGGAELRTRAIATITPAISKAGQTTLTFRAAGVTRATAASASG